MPSAERKSGIPLSVETPAPVRTTHGCRVADQLCQVPGGHPRIVSGARKAPASHRGPCRFAETDAQGIAHHASFVVWFEVARVAYLSEHAGGYLAIQAQGIEALTTALDVRYHRAAYFDDRLRVGRAASTSAARASATSTRSSGVTSSLRTARRRTRPSTRPPAGRRESLRGSPRRSLGPRRRRRRCVRRGIDFARHDGVRLDGRASSAWASASADPDHLRLGAIGRVPVVLVQHGAVRVVDRAADARRPRRLTVLLDFVSPFSSVGSLTRFTFGAPTTRSGCSVVSTRRF